VNSIKNLMKNCKYCGEEFRSSKERRNYCSDECFENFQRDRRKKYSQDNKEAIYKRRTTCKYCGNKFTMKELKERCCENEDCIKDNEKEKIKEAKRKYYNKNIKKTTKKFKKQDAENSRNYRKSHKEQLNKRKRARNRETRDWLDNIKKSKKCSKCKQDKYYILDFHHLDPNEKDKGISQAVNCGYSKKRIMAEIDKCIVLCRNCHGEIHYLQENIKGWQPSEEWLKNSEVNK